MRYEYNYFLKIDVTVDISAYNLVYSKCTERKLQ